MEIIILSFISVWAPLFDNSTVQFIFSLVMDMNIVISSALFIVMQVLWFAFKVRLAENGLKKLFQNVDLWSVIVWIWMWFLLTSAICD